MPNALLLGFNYSDDKLLSGISLDLYRMNLFLQKRGWKTVVCSDRLENTKKEFKPIILENEDTLKDIIQDKFWSLFYFTGHGEKGGCLLPWSNKVISCLTLLQWFGDQCPQMWIWDACGSYRLRLPYIWQDGLKLNLHCLPWHLTEYPLTILSAPAKTSFGSVSISTKNGSILSQALIRVLESSDDLLPGLEQELLRLSSGSVLQEPELICSFPRCFLPIIETFD